MGIALIIGTGSGISAEVARKLKKRGHKLVLTARNTEKLATLGEETSAELIACDATNIADMAELFSKIDAMGEPLDIAMYNPSARVHGAITELDPEGVKKAIEVSAFGAFLMAQQAAKRMIEQGYGAILLTGASASVKGYPRSSSFAMGKFALRGLAQSLARELHPQNIHVGHFVIDGGVRNLTRPGYEGSDEKPDALLEPEGIADSYLYFLDQPRSTWSWEIELRPWVEKF